MIASLARRVGCTEGQLYTVTTGVVVAAALLWSGISPLPADSFSAFLAAPAATVNRSSPPAAAAAPQPVLPAAAPVSVASYDQVNAAPLTSTDGSSNFSSPTPSEPATFAVVGSPGAPGGLAVAPDGRVLVTTDNGSVRGGRGPSHLFAFASDGRTVGDLTISGQPADHTDGTTGVAVDRDGSTVVLDAATNRVLRVAPDLQSVVTVATIPDLKPCLLGIASKPCEPGVTDNKPALVSAVFDASGSLLVTDAGQATIWRWVPGASAPEAWYQAQDLATGDGPCGLAVEANGNLWFTVGTTLDPNDLRGGALYRLTRAADGAPGDRALVASFAPDDRPGALALSTAGIAYVVVRKSGTIVSIDHGATKPMPTDGLPIPLDAPSALAIAGDRLLVANQSASNDASHWAVLSLPI